MNRGVLQSPPAAVQQMMAAGSPNWWNINTMRPPPIPQASSPFLVPPPNNLFPPYSTPPTSSPSFPFSSSWHDDIDNQELPQSWSQLLRGGLVGDEEDQRSCMSHLQGKKLENWEEHMLNQTANCSAVMDVKQENKANSYVYSHADVEFQAASAAKPTCWAPNPMMPVSSPSSCITSLSSNMLEFSTNKSNVIRPPPDLSSECNSTAATGGAAKRARLQPSSAQSTIKVRKEKLGDRITALHQLVSPFGKTDTASVLLEAIGYIRFLQSQIEALSLPYLGSGSGNKRQQQTVHGDKNCLFPEDPGQLLNDKSMKREGLSEQGSDEEQKDLKSRGLCLVPIPCTLQVGSDNGADYWAPAALGGPGFR